MKQLRKIYEEYLEGIGKLDEDIQLGPGKDTKPAEKRETIKPQSQTLTETLNKRFKFNNKVVILAIVLLCLLFATGVYFIFYYRDEPKILGGIFGGTFLSLLSIIRWLHKLWKEKSFIDISLSVLEGLSPEKAAEFINNIYWKTRSS